MTMTRSAPAAIQARAAGPDRRRFPGAAPVPWGTVVVLAVLLAYADGFVLTAVQGAVGAVERTGAPFATWLRTSTLLLPAFLVAVVGGLAFARRRIGPALVRPLRAFAAALVIAAAGSLVGTAVIAVSAAYDYHLQSQALQAAAALHGHLHHAALAGGAAQRDSLAVDAHAARLAGRVIVLTDVVIAVWVTAMRGGRLDRVPRTRRP
jgi:hypothetical protein